MGPVGVCSEVIGAMGNSGYTGKSILRGQLQRWQRDQVLFIRRESFQTAMRAMYVVPVQIVGDVGACRAHALVGLEVHPLVLRAAPQALDEDVIAPGSTSVHGQLA